MNANALTMNDAAVTPTSKEVAKAGSAGETMPMPIATMKLPPTRIQISRGNRVPLPGPPDAWLDDSPDTTASLPLDDPGFPAKRAQPRPGPAHSQQVVGP
ncbi:hypothetical protein GCM10020366_25720 [Saccharopolyspora gregorii]|uniref:Uncharacterized protein n=1 Tax=Saccharopolyspora gregorii TaxID=33914 RepID=A0ABP6RQ68_9PSEU